MLTLEKIIDFSKKNYRFIIAVISLIILIFLGYYSFREYKLEKDLELAKKINLYENVLGAIRNAEEKSLEDEDRRSQIKVELKNLCEQNTGYKNTLRARYILARLDHEDGDFDSAKINFSAIFESDKKHYLSPIALMQFVILLEEEINYEEAIKVLEKHKNTYENHFIYGEILLALARNHTMQGDYDKAGEILQGVLENEKMSVYHSKAEEEIDLLIIKGYLTRSLLDR